MSILLPPCKTCKFWGYANGKQRAKCLRFPPVPHPAGGAEWPMTTEYDACGEHVKKEQGVRE